MLELAALPLFYQIFDSEMFPSKDSSDEAELVLRRRLEVNLDQAPLIVKQAVEVFRWQVGLEHSLRRPNSCMDHWSLRSVR